MGSVFFELFERKMITLAAISLLIFSASTGRRNFTSKDGPVSLVAVPVEQNGYIKGFKLSLKNLTAKAIRAHPPINRLTVDVISKDFETHYKNGRPWVAAFRTISPKGSLDYWEPLEDMIPLDVLNKRVRLMFSYDSTLVDHMAQARLHLSASHPKTPAHLVASTPYYLLEFDTRGRARLIPLQQ